jgi:hypothetical protein
MVELTRDLEECLDFLDSRGTRSRKRLLAVGNPDGPSDSDRQDVDVRSMPNMADLTGLAIEISQFLEGNRHRSADAAICFHSLTSLLQFVDVDRAFRFLHVLVGRIEATDAVAHFHLDRTGHDTQTVGMLTTLFDAVVEPDDDEWTVRRRG